MPNITDLATCSVALSPASMGRAFAKMDSVEQADFFRGVYAVTQTWDQDAGFQWVMMRQHLDEMPDALDAFKKLAEYSPDFDDK